MTGTRISIDPITRLEGHGKIDIFLDDEGEVTETYLQIPELRGFEKFCEGRPVEELPRIVTRICGVCPEAHHLASAKTCDAVYHVDPPPTAKKLRELLYSAFFTGDHTLHFYALGGPDFVVGPTAPAAERNILGVIGKVGLEAGKRVIQLRAGAQEVVKILGGKAVHPVTSLPGGVSKGLTEAERARIEELAKGFVDFAGFTLQVFEDVVLGNPAYVDLITGEVYRQQVHSMGTVDGQGRVNFYDGEVRVVDTAGKPLIQFPAKDYLQHLAEHVEPWTYLKYPYLKRVGWKGFVEGQDSGVYRATPLSRLNAADGMATPKAQAAYVRMYEVLGGKPVHFTLATHWARVIELMYAAEHTLELATDPEITGKDIRTLPTATPDEGVGQVEAPRGTLFHHYQTDARGIVQKVNLIVGTTNNHAAISLAVKRAAKHLIHKGTAPDEGLLNMVEMAFRAFDPCFGCATHSLPGRMPLEIQLRGSDGSLRRTIRRP
jgi:F420-non-reducing hydrogenase large subunit